MKKLFFLGIDSATWDLILPWVAQGKLPGFKTLIHSSDNYYCRSTIPPYTPSAWTTMFTGLSPAKHNVYDFRYITPQNDINITDTTHLSKKYAWHHLSKAGYKVCIYNIPMTFPPQPVNGYMVSSFTTPSTKHQFTYPPTLQRSLLKKFPDYHIIAPGKFNSKDLPASTAYSQNLTQSLQQKIQVSKWLFHQKPWDVFITNVLEIDHVQHFFWRDLTHPTSPFHQAILKCYQLIDRYLSEILQKYSHEYTILVASDHGAGPAYQTIYMNHWLEQNGYLFFKDSNSTKIKHFLRGNLLKPNFLASIANSINLTKKAQAINQDNQNLLVRKIFLDISDIDFKKTRAFAFGEYGGIYLCDHKKSLQLKKQIIKRLIASLGSRITFIDSSSDIYHTKNYGNNIPDIQYLIDDGATTSTSVYSFHTSRIFDQPISDKSANHRPMGIASIIHPRATGKFSTCSLYHITPTLYHIMGLNPPGNHLSRSLLKTAAKSDQITI